MNKYFLQIDNKELEAEITDTKIKTKDSEENFEYKFLTDDLIFLRINNKNYFVKSEFVEDEVLKNTEFSLEVNSKIHKIICKNELELLTEKFSKNRGDVKIKNELVSPMPGAIVKINVKEGDEVKKGQVLIVLEAMKMENELKAAGDCVIGKILVEEKMPVDKNQLLIKYVI